MKTVKYWNCLIEHLNKTVDVHSWVASPFTHWQLILLDIYTVLVVLNNITNNHDNNIKRVEDNDVLII